MPSIGALVTRSVSVAIAASGLASHVASIGRLTDSHAPLVPTQSQSSRPISPFAPPAMDAPPISRLYRHALESVFAFLTLRLLSRHLCRVHGLRPFAAWQALSSLCNARRPPSLSILASSLSKHIGKIAPR